MTNFEPRQFGKYLLLEKLAVGGMAEIYKAKTYGAEGFEKLMAIKRILSHAAEDKEFIHMLIDEAKLSVLLSHANIVQVFDLGKIGTDYFISMEFIHGINLRDVLYRLRERDKKIPTELAVYIASEVCKGLDYAHRKTDSNNQPLGIVHRDISPQNILISYEGEVKIVDFGIAKAAMNISHTMAGILKGKIAYMSPEQAMGKAVDDRTDLFSLGIVLYESLSGKKLFTGESQFEVLKKIRTSRMDATKLPPTIPAPLKTILAKTLAYQVEERYPSASDMQIALTKYLYATYTDFSPRKLSSFVKELFADELKKEKSKKELEAMEAQTGSISLITGKPQETLVHRESGGPTAQGPATQGPMAPEITHPLTGVVKGLPIAKRAVRGKNWMRTTALGLMLSAGVGLALWHFFFRPEAPLPLTPQGTLHIASDPPGADIYLNGAPTPLKTPAILDNLELNKTHTISLAMENYGRLEKSIVLPNEEPVFLNIPLSKHTGLLNIISEPPGAAILVNGIATGKVTPNLLDDLGLQTEYRITLSKPNYKDFEQPITLTSIDPQKIMTTLEPMESLLKGSLLVESDPSGAKIFLDNLDTGKVTPAKLEDLKVGSQYALRLEKENYQTLEKKMEIASIQPIVLLEKLTAKELAAIPEKIVEPKETKPKEVKPKDQRPKPEIQQPEKKATAPEPETKVPAGVGSLQVASNPSGADVFVNGEHRGNTPVSFNLPSGKMRILVTKGDDTLPCRREITLRPGQTERIDCSLGPLYGRIEIASYPPRAEVYFNGKKMGGQTPIIIKKVKRDQEHTLRIELKGYRPWVRAFNLRDQETKTFNVELEGG